MSPPAVGALSAAGWLVIVEIIGKLVAFAMDKWGAPTEEVKKKLLAQVTLPSPGEADAALTEISPPK